MSESYIISLLATIFVFIGFDLMRPAVTSYLSKVAGNEQGFVSGMNSMFTSFGNMFGPIVGGALFDINLDYPFYFAAFALIIGIILTFFWKQPTYEDEMEKLEEDKKNYIKIDRERIKNIIFI